MPQSRPRTSSKFPAYPPAHPQGPLVPIHNIPQTGSMPIALSFASQHQALQRHIYAQKAPRSRRRTPQLPPELVAEIIAFVSDKGTLAACARVSSTFYQPAQKLFFNEITVYIKPSSKRPKQSPHRFYGLLHRSKHIIKWIRSLVVHTGSGSSSDDETTYLHKVTPYLTKLESLSFPRYPCNHVSHPTNIPLFPPLTHSQTTNLRKLDISALTDHQLPSLTFFTRLNNLRDLTLDPSFSSESPLAWGLHHNPHSYTQLSLRSLTLVGKFTMDQAMGLFASTAFPCNVDGRLRSLHVDQGDIQWVDLDPYRDLKPLAGLFSVCRGIEYFTFTRCPRSTYFIPTKQVITPFSKLARPPDLSCAIGLRTITLQGTVEAIANEYPGHGVRRSNLERWLVASPLSWMESLLASIHPGCPLREISLRIDVSHFMVEELLGVMNAQWDSLCAVMTPERFPALRRVRLHVHAACEGNPKIVASILGQAPASLRLMKIGILRLDLSNDFTT